MRKKVPFLLVLLAILCPACRTVSSEVREELARPVDCATAREDIAALRSEKASVAKQLASGVRPVLPAAAVIGILSGDYGNRVEVAVGKYNRDLDAKITEIRLACGIE